MTTYYDAFRFRLKVIMISRSKSMVSLTLSFQDRVRIWSWFFCMSPQVDFFGSTWASFGIVTVVVLLGFLWSGKIVMFMENWARMQSSKAQLPKTGGSCGTAKTAPRQETTKKRVFIFLKGEFFRFWVSPTLALKWQRNCVISSFVFHSATHSAWLFSCSADSSDKAIISCTVQIMAGHCRLYFTLLRAMRWAEYVILDHMPAIWRCYVHKSKRLYPN